MKRFYLLLAIFFPLICQAQYLKVSSGMTFSSMKENKLNILRNTKNGFNIKIGMDYFEHSYFYLSSEVGYITTGGSDIIYTSVEGDTFENLDLTLSNLHLNTTFRGKLKIINNLDIYIGCGPKLDYQFHPKFKGLSEFNFEPQGPFVFPKNKLVFGLKPEVGLRYKFNRIYIGVEYSYLYNINKSSNELTNNSSLLNLNIGYHLY